MHILSQQNRSEFLAVPQLVRFDMPHRAAGREPTLLIKANTLQLKYLLRLKRFRLVFVSTSADYLGYGIELPDDPGNPGIVWSLLENSDELSTLRTLLDAPTCVVSLFNEIALNVAWTRVDLGLNQPKLRNMIQSTKLHPTGDKAAAEEAISGFDALQKDAACCPTTVALDASSISEWHEIRSSYVTNRITASEVTIFSSDEGGQQEEIALWLVDNLRPDGAIKNPRVHEPNKTPRELADLLLSHRFGAILLESKSLSILSRGNLPSRKKLVGDISKHIGKASAQLSGGIKNLKRGYKISDAEEREVLVERTNPPHAVILVPDLTLLADLTEFGGPFLRRFYQESGGMLHFLDLSELLRVVQAAEVISSKSSTATKMMAFDYYLMERMKVAASRASPHVEIILRVFDQKTDSA